MSKHCEVVQPGWYWMDQTCYWKNSAPFPVEVVKVTPHFFWISDETNGLAGGSWNPRRDRKKKRLWRTYADWKHDAVESKQQEIACAKEQITRTEKQSEKIVKARRPKMPAAAKKAGLV